MNSAELEAIKSYCAEGASVYERYYETFPGVKLRVIEISPARQIPEHPPVVFVPGWITQTIAWKNVLARWSEDFKIYYVETREKISSHISGKQQFSVSDLGKDLIQLISTWQFPDNGYILFGSSLGATVILDCVNSLPTKPLCLLLVGPNAEFRVPKLGMVVIRLFYPGFYSVIKPVVKWYLKTFRLDVAADYAQYQKYCNALDAADPWKLKKAIIPFSKYKVWELLGAIQTNTLIIGASKDKLHEPANLEKMVELLPNVRYIDLETNMGTHSAQLVDEIRVYLNTLAEFHCRCKACAALTPDAH